MRIERIAPQLVELAPPTLEPGVLYISHKYKVAVHLCCCGCGEKVVTPLSPAEWRVTLTEGNATLYPSIGNWAMRCRSHYWIRNNGVIWARAFSQDMIDAVHRRDQAAIEAMHRARAADKAPPPAVHPPAARPWTVENFVPGWLLRLTHWVFGR